jgi:hypothetical protein
MKRLTLILIAVLLALPAGAKKAKHKAKKHPPKLYEVKDGGFALALPRGWPQRRDVRRDKKRNIFSVTAEGQRNKAGAAVMILARFYGPGNGYFENGAAYLKRQYQEDILPPPPGEKTYPTKKTKLNGHEAKVFRRDASLVLPRNSLKAKDVPMREEHIVLDHAGGFFVVSYVAPKELYNRHYPAFTRARATFRIAAPEPRADKKTVE